MPAHSKLTQKLTDEICKLIRAGNYRETACAAVGVDSSTMRSWLRKAARDREKRRENMHTRFAAAILEAEAQSEARDVAVIGTAAKQDWRAAAHRLDRRYAKRWGQQVNVKVEAELENFLRVAERVLESEAFARLVEALAAQDGGTETG